MRSISHWLVQAVSAVALTTVFFTFGSEAQTQKKLTSKPAVSNDIVSVVRHFAALKGQKGEFETTARYEGRMKTAIPTSKHSFVYVFNNYQSCDCAYDADKAQINVSLHLDREKFAEGTERPLSVRITDVTRYEDKHVGQNGFGATTVYTTNSRDEYGILLSEKNVTWLSSFPAMGTFAASLSIEQAKRVKPSLAIMLVGTIPTDAQLREAHLYFKPTFDDPSEIIVYQHYLDFDVSEVRIIDTRTGSIFGTFRPD